MHALPQIALWTMCTSKCRPAGAAGRLVLAVSTSWWLLTMSTMTLLLAALAAVSASHGRLTAGLPTQHQRKSATKVTCLPTKQCRD